MIRAIRSVLHDRRGNATLELAFATPILLVMSLGVIDTSLGYLHRMKMQQYAQIGADYVYSKMEDIPSDTVVKQEIANATGKSMSDITVDTWIECSGTKTALPACLNAGDTVTRFMKIDVQGTYTPILNIPKYAAFVQSYTSHGAVTIQTK